MQPRSFARHPLALPLLLGALARLIAAIVGLSFHARDDYFHVLEPALRWIADPSFVWETSDVPGAGIRSHLIPRVVQGLVLTARALGLTSPESTLRFVYAVFGLYSLLVIPPMYALVRRLADERSATIAAWLGALFFVMPYAGTRLLIEAVAMPPLVLGLYFATFTQTWRLMLAGFFVGIACWFRFQVGVLGLGLAGVLAWQGYRSSGVKALVRNTGALALGALVAIALQGWFDLVTTGTFLGPVLANIRVNMDPLKDLSRSGPFAYLGMWLLLTVPPATFVLLPALWQAGKRLVLVSVPFLVFVLVHSFVPHKEERFMLPVVPLFLVLVACAPWALAESTWTKLKTYVRPAQKWFVGACAVLLLVAITNQSQKNLREAMHVVRDDAGATGIVSFGPELQTYFLGGRALPTHRTSKPNAGWLLRTLQDAPTPPPNRFVVFEPDRDAAALAFAAAGLMCDEPAREEGYWLDRALYAANPKRNRRRAPVLIFACEQPAVATWWPAR